MSRSPALLFFGSFCGAPDGAFPFAPTGSSDFPWKSASHGSHLPMEVLFPWKSTSHEGLQRYKIKEVQHEQIP